MAKKRRLTWRNLAWGVLTEAALFGVCILLTALLLVRGVVPMERCCLLLALGALLSCGAGGMLFGKWTPVRGWGSVLCSGLLMACLLIGNLNYDTGLALSGTPILLCALLGGIVGLLLPRQRKHKLRRR